MSKENVEIVRSHIEAYQSGDVSGLMSLLDPNVVLDTSRVPSLDVGPAYGHEEVVRSVRHYPSSLDWSPPVSQGSCYSREAEPRTRVSPAAVRRAADRFALTARWFETRRAPELAANAVPLREEETLERLGEPWRCGDEMPGAGGDQALRVECGGQGIADALDPRRVIA
jgi:hypothetical protein